MKTFLLETSSLNPYYNLALEALAMKTIDDRHAILHLWQSRDAVIIGKHQNPWAETTPKRLNRNNISLVRRFSGGGTVFHDLGNLNYCFIHDKKNYDVARQMNVVLDAVRAFNIDAEFNCRNDLTVNQKKFSGSAFCLKKNAALHHGTLLVDADTDRLSRFLKPADIKIIDKGIKSTRSDVVNLSALSETINIPDLKKALSQSFADQYGKDLSIIHPSDIASENEVDTLVKSRKTPEWLYGHCMPFDAEFSRTFSFGKVTLLLHVKKAFIETAKIQCSGIDDNIRFKIADRLIGVSFDNECLSMRLKEVNHAVSHTLSDWVKSILI